ncbi:MAG: cysteine dioxygenase family protein [Chloroflexota bacterium]|nr:cysteine dioxygenase family protein [Chloroflexota bacterium]
MTTVKYSLDEFIHDMEALLRDQPDQHRIFDQGSSYLEKLIANPAAIPEEYLVPVGNGARSNHGSYALYQGDSGLLVTSVVWGPGDHASPHDHCTWGMIGVMGNNLTETRFRRVDDRETEGYARLEKDRSVEFTSGEITLLIPEVDEIHQMDNFTDRPTVEIHVYGNDLRGLHRSRYDLESGKIIPFVTERYDNC